MASAPPALRTDGVSAPAWVYPCLLAEVQQYGGFDPGCLNCGGCSVVCELTYGDVTFPRRPIRRVVLGLRQDVLEGLEPWLCHDCGDCSLTCPRQADPAESMRTLRRFLTGQYDGTGLAARILRSQAWHLATPYSPQPFPPLPPGVPGGPTAPAAPQEQPEPPAQPPPR